VSAYRLPDYLEHIQQAASDACSFIEGMGKDDFLADKRTRNAVVMSLIAIGETGAKVMDRYPAFAARHAEIPWLRMRDTRNRIAHGYFDIDFDIVWDTAKTALPTLLEQLAAIGDIGTDEV
jgi:uncharacterized protein with HEPN domain